MAVPAPAGLRRLDELAADLLPRAQASAPRLTEPADQRLWQTAISTLAQLLPVRQHQLLHWDLHYGNVLAGQREPWLAIDPKPLAGEPGFELLPALRNRWSELLVQGGPVAGVRGRFDLLVEAAGLDRHRAAGWTLARILEDTCWQLESGTTTIRPEYRVIAEALGADLP
ncbi:hypothetical protein JQS43_13740 [Natronosporangium hydrolyticum]|uniref:Streptomycin 6-kinase n=1 Tax=Natronosporangium hydrolyticum TaxID=2811111 RepID=A0A895Y4X6_9ACTN|nr:hypothetical protein JQS43_13740 [Natronosporangium hydrolyticum]